MLINRQQEKYGWEFVFLGANIDAAETAESIGIGSSTAVDCVYDREGCAMQYRAMCTAISSVRHGKNLSESSAWRKDIDEDRRRRKG